jgi:uncharacterized membrane protein YfcA
VLVVGGIVAAAVALLAGTSGFGFGLLATPALLLVGFSLPFVVTANLLISLATRLSVAYRLRVSIDRRRVALLLAGSIPGLWVGARVLGAVDAHDLEVGVGIVIMIAAVALAYADRHPPREHGPGAPVAAGFLGGLLGTTTSLIGVPPALILARRRVGPAGFFADLAVYFIVASAIGLAVLAADGHFNGDAAHAFVYWLPGVLVGNVLGTTLGLRIPPRTFRWVTLALAFAAGAVTAATA